MGTTVRSLKHLPAIGAAQSTERWKKPRSTQIEAAAGEKGIGVRKRIFFHLPGSLPEQEDMKTHVTMPGVRWRMDAEVVDIRETERKFQADMPPLEPLDMNMVTRATTILFRKAKELAKGNRRRAVHVGVRPQSTFSRALRFRTCRWDRGERKASVEEITKSAKKYTRAKKELVSVLVHAQRAFHTPCNAHCDKRNDRKECWEQESFTSFALCGQVSLLQW